MASIRIPVACLEAAYIESAEVTGRSTPRPPKRTGIIILIIIIITSSSDLQPSMALANQLPGQLVSTQIRTTRPNCFKFIIALIMTSTNIV